MSRNEEYQALLSELEQEPVALKNVAQKALNREKALQLKRRGIGISVGSFVACIAVFVVMVNCFPAFAKACEDIPVLRTLAEAVRFSPSLRAAVKNEYVQPMDLSETKNSITAAVKYVIVDRRQVSIFFTLDSDETEYLDFDHRVTAPDNKGRIGSSTGSFGLKNGELRQIDVTFINRDVTDTLQLSLKVYATPWKQAQSTNAASEQAPLAQKDETTPHYLAEFDFTLEFDPYFTAQGERIPINHVFSIDGQSIILTEVEMYPTHMRVNLDDTIENTAWLKGLELYLENEHGERFGSSVNGISASGDPDDDGESYAVFWMDSPFFSQGEHLTLHITEARWLDKNAERVCINLKNQSADNLPQNVRFLGAEQWGGQWTLSFAAPKSSDGSMGNLFSGKFWDEMGNEYDIMQWSSTIGYEDPDTGERLEEETMFTDTFPLEGFTGDVVFLEPAFTHVSNLADAPVAIPIQ